MVLCLGPVKSGKTQLLKYLGGYEIDDATTFVQTNGTNLFDIKNSDKCFVLGIRELGGTMAPIWKNYLDKISAAGVLLYLLLVEPKLENAKFALVLTKMDLSYRQMRNEALLMLHFSQLQKEVQQQITVIEASGLTGQGVDKLRQWLFDPATLAKAKLADKAAWSLHNYSNNFGRFWDFKDNIDRITESEVSSEEFIRRYEKPYIPVIILSAHKKKKRRKLNNSQP